MTNRALAILIFVSSLAQNLPAAEPADTASMDPSSEMEEVTVTALRRSERLQDVPVSITALAGAALAEQKITNLTDVVSLVPNLQAGGTVGEGVPVFALRGVSMADFSLNQQGPVATYYDEVYKGSFPFLGLDLFDIERIEVLRGPQGTLYGKNTTGGAVNLISRKPGFDTEGYLTLGYGNYDRKEANGAYQAALSDKLAMRTAFTYAYGDGWFRNALPGHPDMNGTDQWGARLSLLYNANDRLSFLLRLTGTRQNPINFGIYARPGAAGIGAGIYEAYGIELSDSALFRAGLSRYELEDERALHRLHKTASAALTTTWNISDALAVTSVTSTDYGRLYVPEDADGSPMALIEDDVFSVAHQMAEDLRIASAHDTGLNYIFGVYYNRESMTAGTEFHYFTDIPLPCQPSLVACVVRNHFDQTKTTTAAYADLSYKLSEPFILRSGLRVTHDRGSISDYRAQLLNSDGTPVANTVPGSLDFNATTGDHFSNDNVTGKVGFDYKPTPENLLYISVSKGYRASAFNAQAYFLPTELNVAGPETVWAYELGAKSQLLNRLITVNAALFHYAYRGQQALNVDSAPLAQTLVNIPRSRIDGAEVELTAHPIDALRLNLGVGLLRTRIQDAVVSGVDLSGNRLPNSPSVSLTTGVDWDVARTSQGRFTLGLNANMNSKQYLELFNVPRLAQKSVTLLNGQLRYHTPDDRYGVSVWGRNLGNKFYVTSAIDVSGFGFDYFHLGTPRTYGIDFDARL